MVILSVFNYLVGQWFGLLKRSSRCLGIWVKSMQLESRMNAIYQILWTAGLPFFLVFAHMVINKTSCFQPKRAKKNIRFRHSVSPILVLLGYKDLYVNLGWFNATLRTRTATLLNGRDKAAELLCMHTIYWQKWARLHTLQCFSY